MRLEGLERVQVVSRDEDHRRRTFVTERGEDLEAIEAGHLHIEEEQLGTVGLHPRNRGNAVLGLADHLDLRKGGKHRPQTGAGQRLVIDQQGSQFHPPSTRNGSSSQTRHPPWAAAPMEKRCASP